MSWDGHYNVNYEFYNHKYNNATRKIDVNYSSDNQSSVVMTTSAVHINVILILHALMEDNCLLSV